MELDNELIPLDFKSPKPNQVLPDKIVMDATIPSGHPLPGPGIVFFLYNPTNTSLLEMLVLLNLGHLIFSVKSIKSGLGIPFLLMAGNIAP
ncbi:MAG: hypothetical protein EA411_07480 [Saprospirales bacterium]|nr:MAG: hypothetical protein EA411_07480 [Saprospirales bacterium]